jgi:hypothetical protein
MIGLALSLLVVAIASVAGSSIAVSVRSHGYPWWMVLIPPVISSCAWTYMVNRLRNYSLVQLSVAYDSVAGAIWILGLLFLSAELSSKEIVSLILLLLSVLVVAL